MHLHESDYALPFSPSIPPSLPPSASSLLQSINDSLLCEFTRTPLGLLEQHQASKLGGSSNSRNALLLSVAPLWTSPFCDVTKGVYKPGEWQLQ